MDYELLIRRQLTQSEERWMLRIERLANEEIVFRLIGQLDAENVFELETLLEKEAESTPIVLDLKDLTLVDREAVRFLGQCETGQIKLANCPAYIRTWIEREK